MNILRCHNVKFFDFLLVFFINVSIHYLLLILFILFFVSYYHISYFVLSIHYSSSISGEVLYVLSLLSIVTVYL